MTHIKYCFFSLSILLFVACGQNNPTTTEKTIDSNQVVNHNNTSQQDSGTIDWLTPKDFTPTSFLHAVAKQNNSDTVINVLTMVDDFPMNWVKESDIDTLITLISSTRKCNCFLNPLSSFIPTNKHADIGGYAIIFINSFRHKNRINLGFYSCPNTDKQSVKEINQWWANYKQTK